MSKQDRRRPVISRKVDPAETYEARIIRLERQIQALETAFVSLRNELTRCNVMLDEASTDVAVLQRRLMDGKTPERYHVRDIGK